jgi:hypothetical protein
MLSRGGVVSNETARPPITNLGANSSRMEHGSSTLPAMTNVPTDSGHVTGKNLRKTTYTGHFRRIIFRRNQKLE